MKKLTITVSDEVYRGLRKKIGPGKISRFIDGLARPYVTDDSYRTALRSMAADQLREGEAEEWTEGLIGDAYGENK